MIIKEIDYKSYGKLRNQKLSLVPGINVVYGENEAGKSTVFSSIKTAFYGFTPQLRERHPYSNWETGELEFTTTFETSAGEVSVTRRLMSQPKTTIISRESGTVETFRNEALMPVRGISESLFSSVFHLTAEDLSRLEDETWERIQENLIFNYGIDYLRKTGDILSELDAEINSIWRKDRRGNPLIQQRLSELRGISDRKHELELQYDKIADLSREIDALGDRERRLNQQKSEMEQAYRDIQLLIPIKEKIEKLDFLKQQLKNLEWQERIEENDLNLYTVLKSDLLELDGELEALLAEKSSAEVQLMPFESESAAILENADKIEYAKTQLSKLEQLESQLQILTAELSKKGDFIQYQFKLMFEEDYSSGLETSLLKLNPLEIKTELYKYIEISKRSQAQSEAPKGYFELAVLVAGILMVSAMAVMRQLLPLGLLGTALIGFSASRYLARKKPTTTIHEAAPIKLQLMELFKPMNLPDYVWADASFMFIGKLEHLLATIFERSQLEERIRALKQDFEKIEKELREILSFVHMSDVHNVRLSVHMIGLKLEKLRSEARRQEQLAFEVAEIEKRISNTAAKRRTKGEQLSEIEMKFLNLGQGDLEMGFKVYQENIELLKRIKVFEEEKLLLGDRVLAYEEFEMKATVCQMYLDEMNRTISELSGDIQSTVLEKSKLEREVTSLKAHADMDELESERLLCQEEVEQLYEKRNQLMVLREIIQYADEKFRRENQPDILQRVSLYMSQITNGKYREVLIGEENGKFELQFLVGREVFPISKAFSKGTVHQLFLAFRLSVIDSINESEEKLPIVLDEAFSNWDGERLKSVRRIIEEISKKRQVIFFTCHKEQARLFERAYQVELNAN